ncbi:MAG: hypothetical protein EOM37_02345 [Proteobacteria bacterium]|jgi:hypothetical protein|nr:hypothetical protein [Alphaproteobacteria bacterium]NCC02876.1 hypothetical protein [Pseudomonadota bacterium]
MPSVDHVPALRHPIAYLAAIYHRAEARYVDGYLKESVEQNVLLHPDVYRLAARDVFKRVPFIVRRDPRLTFQLLTNLVKAAPDDSSLFPVIAQSMMFLPELVASSLPPCLQQHEDVLEQDTYAPSLLLRSVSHKLFLPAEILNGAQGYGVNGSYLTIAYAPMSKGRMANYFFALSEKGKQMRVVATDFAAAGKDNALLASDLYLDKAGHQVCSTLVAQAAVLEKDFSRSLPLSEVVQFRITRARYRGLGLEA